MADTLTVQASAMGVQQTPRKVALVAALVRGRTVADALVILSYTPKRAAVPVIKAIQSAAANAKQSRIDDKTLLIETLTVTAGPRLKRFRAGARGMAKPYQKRTSHIFVAVSGTVKPAKAATKPAAVKKEVK